MLVKKGIQIRSNNGRFSSLRELITVDPITLVPKDTFDVGEQIGFAGGKIGTSPLSPTFTPSGAVNASRIIQSGFSGATITIGGTDTTGAAIALSVKLKDGAATPAVISILTDPVIAPITIDETLVSRTTVGSYTVDVGSINTVTRWKDSIGNDLTGVQSLTEGMTVIAVDTVTASTGGTVLINESDPVVVRASKIPTIEAASFSVVGGGDPATLTINDGAGNTLSTDGPWTLHLAFSANPITLTAAQIKAKTPTTGVAFYSALYDPNGGTPILIDAKAQGSLYGAITAGNGSVLTAVRNITGVNIIDSTPPYVVSFSPVDNATDIPTDGSIVVTYNTPVYDGLSGVATIGNVTVGLEDCEFDGNTMTINYTGLTGVAEAVVSIPSSMVVDQYGNQPAPIELGDYSFTTAEVVVEPVTPLTHQYIGTAVNRGSGQGAAAGGTYTNTDEALGINGLVAGQTVFLFPNRQANSPHTAGTLEWTRPVQFATRLAGIGSVGAATEAFQLALSVNATSSEFIKYVNATEGGNYRLSGFFGEVPPGAVIRTATGSRTTGVADPVSVNIQVDEGGYVLAALASNGTLTPITWVGVDKHVELPAGASKIVSVASRSFTTSGVKTITVNDTGTSAMAVVLVSVSPAP